MPQPKHVNAYGADHLALLLSATHTPRFAPVPRRPDEPDNTLAKKRAMAFVHRTNGLKRALLLEEHPLARDCAAIRVRMPQPAPDGNGYVVELSRTTLSGMGVVLDEEMDIPGDTSDAPWPDDDAAMPDEPTDASDAIMTALDDEEI